MILAVNIGNTNVRAAIGQRETVSDIVLPGRMGEQSGAVCRTTSPGRMGEQSGAVCRTTKEASQTPLSPGRMGESFIHLIERHFGADIWVRIDGSIVSSVVPNLTPVVMDSIVNKTGKMPQRINARSCGGLDVRHYDGIPGEDRLVCCVGAMQKYAPPFILIDFGTATTINVVSGDSEFLGGAILAGVQIGLKALSDNTAQLPQITVDTDVPVIGKGTRENLISGAIIGAACAVDGYVRRIEREMGRSMPIVVTGGHAPLILPHCEFEYIHEPNLVLDGLFALYK